MEKLQKQELLNIEGGAISGSFLSSLIKGINSLLELGRSLGTAIRRVYTKKICPIGF